jgi:aspartyl-tRNA(Asn)/glutamyl-tRNA(Gln) amidotransferase subunit A
MDEFAMGSSNETSFFGCVKNPYDLTRVSGGSSGGSAAAIAAGMVPLALGSDTGGSIRQPASFCEVVSVKPTYGLVSRYGVSALASSFDQVGPMANSIDDAKYLLQVIATADKRDATNCQKAFVGFAKKEINGAVIGLPKEYLTSDLPQNVRALFDEKVKYLKDNGAKFVDISLENTEHSVSAYCVLATAEASSNMSCIDGVRFGYRSKEAKTLDEMYKLTRAQGLGEEVKRRIMLGTYFLSSGQYEAYYLQAARIRSLIIADFNKAFAECDIILSPITPTPAFKIGEILDPVQMYLNDKYVVSANLVGCPAVALPMGKIDGLPIGIQIMAPNFKGEYAYAVSKELEKSNN